MELKQSKISKDDSRLDEVLNFVTSGQLQEAVSFCNDYLKKKKNPAIDFVLGHALLRLGDADNGIKSIENGRFKAVKDPYCLYRMGHLASETGHLDQAVTCFKKALAFDKNFWEALFNLANTLKRQFKYREALECYVKVIKINPGFSDALFNAGQIYETLNDLDKAQKCYIKVLEKKQNDDEALCGLGRCYDHNSESTLARDCWDKALEINPKSASAYNDIVNTHIRNNEWDKAQTQLDASIEAGIEHESIYLNMGRILNVGSNDAELAQQVFEQGVEKYPRVPELWNALVGLLIGKAQYKEAEEILNSLMSVGMGVWYLKLAMCKVLFETSRLDEAESLTEEVLELDPDNGIIISSLLASKAYNSTHTPEELFEAHKKYGARLEAGKKGVLSPRKYSRRLGDIIKVGYVSPDFREHATSRFMEPIIANHDREKFHITLYSQSKFVDATTNRLQDYSDDWCFTSGMDDLELAKKIQEDEIDILVDLAGHTPGNRLGAFAYKPAPIQASWMGYPYTTGMKSIDYYIADTKMIPEENHKYFTEKIVYLPFDREKKRSSKVNWLPSGVAFTEVSPFLANGYITFGCFNRLEKMSDDLLNAWADILNQVPKSKLILKNRNFDSEEYKQRYIELFGNKGIENTRLDFRGSSSLADYLSVFNEIDIGLDTYPYNGSTVSYDSIRMGVTFVTLTGQASQSKVGASLLIAQKLDNFIAHNISEYIDKVVAYACSPEEIIRLRHKLVYRSRDPWNEDIMDWAVVPLEEVYMRVLP